MRCFTNEYDDKNINLFDSDSIYKMKFYKLNIIMLF